MVPAWLVAKLKADEERKRKEAQDAARLQLPIPEPKEIPLKV